MQQPGARDRLRLAVLVLGLVEGTHVAAALQLPSQQLIPTAAAAHVRPLSGRVTSPPRMQEPPLPLPYTVPKQAKPFADYEWDDDFPGTMKPGKRRENYELDEVLEAWEGRDNPACLELPQDVLFQVPMAPPEDILSWLERIGLLDDEEVRTDRPPSAPRRLRLFCCVRDGSIRGPLTSCALFCRWRATKSAGLAATFRSTTSSTSMRTSWNRAASRTRSHPPRPA
jgi:hypothetical protein